MTAGPTPSQVEAEDWLRTMSWEMRDADGNEVTTLDALADVLAMSRKDAAAAVLRLPFGQAAPDDLRAEAEAEVGDQASPVGASGTEVKRWREADHPRDKNGMFAMLGAIVRLVGGGQGRIESRASRGRITVRKDDGTATVVKPSTVEVRPEAGKSPAVRKATAAVHKATTGPAAKTPAAVPKKPSKPAEQPPKRYDRDGYRDYKAEIDSLGPKGQAAFEQARRDRNTHDDSMAKGGAADAAAGYVAKKPDPTRKPRVTSSNDEYADPLDEREASIAKAKAKKKADNRAAAKADLAEREKDPSFTDPADFADLRRRVAKNDADEDKERARYGIPKSKGRPAPPAKGTVDDPIDVQGDVTKAADLIRDGKHIRLNSPTEVATLLDRLREMVDDAKKKGEKAPVYDLCNVSVPGTNVFCSETKGVPRIRMPQFGGEAVVNSRAEREAVDGKADGTLAFIESLRKDGIKITDKSMPASNLRASQVELDGAKVAGMMGAMQAGRLPEGAIFVSRDGYVIDGHHRWAAKVGVDASDGQFGDVEMPVVMLDLDIGAAFDYANAFTKSYGIKPQGVETNLASKSMVQRKEWTHLDGTPVEGKAVVFREVQHPRDRTGRFTILGSIVRMASGGPGTVVGERAATIGHRASITVESPDGSTRDVDPATVDVVTVNTPEAPPRPASLDANRAQARVAAIAAEAADHTRWSDAQWRNVARGDPDGRVGTPNNPVAPLSTEAYNEREHRVAAALDAAKHLETIKTHTVGGDGKRWTLERTKVHDEILDHFWAQGASVPNDGQGLIAGGLGGAGKTTQLRNDPTINQGAFFTINPDDIKEEMARRGLIPEVEGMQPMEASGLVHEESSYLALTLADRAYAERKNVIWDITMSSRGSVEKRLALMRANGYTNVQAMFVDIPVEMAVDRALLRHREGMERYRNGVGAGGRYVSPSIIRHAAVTDDSSENHVVFTDLLPQFDGFIEWDTSGEKAVRKRSEGWAFAGAAGLDRLSGATGGSDVPWFPGGT